MKESWVPMEGSYGVHPEASGASTHRSTLRSKERFALPAERKPETAAILRGQRCEGPEFGNPNRMHGTGVYIYIYLPT